LVPGKLNVPAVAPQLPTEAVEPEAAVAAHDLQEPAELEQEETSAKSKLYERPGPGYYRAAKEVR